MAFKASARAKAEREWLKKFVRQNAYVLFPEQLVFRCRNAGYSVDPDPWSTRLSAAVPCWLQAGVGASVVRIGDGESNLLVYARFKQIPDALSEFARRIVAMQGDRCATHPAALEQLRDEQWRGVMESDVLGLCGVWRPRPTSVDEVVGMLESDPRGAAGYVLGMHYLCERLERGEVPKTVQIASAHVYFGVLRHLGKLFASAREIFCLTNRPEAVLTLRAKFPERSFVEIPVGHRGTVESDDPVESIDETMASLPARLDSKLCLIGAGPWASSYCSRIKARGGVAIDLGSGFDLLCKQKTRPVHRLVDESAWMLE